MKLLTRTPCNASGQSFLEQKWKIKRNLPNNLTKNLVGKNQKNGHLKIDEVEKSLQNLRGGYSGRTSKCCLIGLHKDENIYTVVYCVAA